MFQGNIISGEQLRAARALLNLGRNECGALAKVSPETIKNIEHEVVDPQPTTNERLVRLFAQHGIEFLKACKVRLQTHSGKDLDVAVRIDGVLRIRPVLEPTSDAQPPKGQSIEEAAV